jgi:ADP-ribosyltransferase exoenzyme
VLAEADVKIRNGFKVSGIAPPDLASYDATTRKLYWTWVLKLALARKDRELAAGLDKDGAPLRPISEYTRKNRRSAMTPSGKGDPNAPPLTPGYQKSRTRSLLAGRALSTHVDMFWKFDSWTGESWAVVLSYQAARGRDVFGISQEGLAWLKVKSWAMWADYKAGTLEQVPEQKAKRLGIPQIGRYKAEHVDFGVSTSGASGAPANFKPGKWTGFTTPAERAAYYRQTAAASLPGRAKNPGSKHPDVGPKYNRLLAHVWGRAGKGGPGGSPAKGPKLTPPAAPTPRPPKPTFRPKFYPQDFALPIRGRKINTPAEPYGDYLPTDEEIAKPFKKPKPKKPAAPKLPPFPAPGATMEPVRALGGSTGAKLVKGPDGRLYVAKSGANQGHLREEATADELYRKMGLDVPRSKIYERPDGPLKLSEFHEGVTLGSLEHSNPQAYAAAKLELRKGFVADALLANWDVIGSGGDNVLVTAAGKVLRIDNGGSLRYRAQGGLKSSSQWGGTVGELTSMRNPSMNSDAAKVFAGITEEEIKAQVKAIIRRQASILQAAPEELRDVLKQRIEYLKNYIKPKKAQKPIKIGDWKASDPAIFKTFESTSAADAWAEEQYKEWAKGLSPRERAAIQGHKSSSSTVNRALRSGSSDDTDEATKERIKLLDAAFSRSPVPEAVTVYRHFDLSDVGLTYDQVKLGSDIMDPGFIPTSVNPHHSWSGHRFEIRVPAGTPAGYSKMIGTGFHSEYELTLGRQADRFRVVELKADEHRTIVVEVVQPQPAKKKKK